MGELLERVLATSEKVLRSSSAEEPREFERAYQKLLALREQLRLVQKGLRSWASSSAMMGESAVVLAQAVATERETFQQLAGAIKQQLSDTSALQSVDKKVATLDGLVAERKRLATVHLLLNRADRRFKTAASRSTAEHKLARLADKKRAAQCRYEELYAEVLASIEFVVREADVHGTCSVVAPELANFRKLQSDFFRNCEEIVQGSGKEEPRDLGEQWDEFSRAMTQVRAHSVRQVRESASSPAADPWQRQEQDEEDWEEPEAVRLARERQQRQQPQKQKQKQKRKKQEQQEQQQQQGRKGSSPADLFAKSVEALQQQEKQNGRRKGSSVAPPPPQRRQPSGKRGKGSRGERSTDGESSFSHQFAPANKSREPMASMGSMVSMTSMVR